MLWAGDGVFVDPVYWTNASSVTASIADAEADTSQAFCLLEPAKGPNKSKKMIKGLGIFWDTTESAGSTDTAVYLSMDISADASTWKEFAKLDTIIVEDAEECYNVSLTDLPPIPWARFRITSYTSGDDTVAVTAEIVREF